MASTSGRSSRSTFTQHEALVHQRGDLRVLEGLALHDVAPVAGGVADRDEQRPVLVARAARAPPRPTAASRPGCRGAGAGTARSRWRGALAMARRSRCASPSVAHPRYADDDVPSPPHRHRRGRPRRRRALLATPSSPAACSSARARSPLDPATGELVGGPLGEQATPLPAEPRRRLRRRRRALADAVRLTVYLDDLGASPRSTRPTARSSATTRRRASTIGVAALPHGRAGRDRRRRRAARLTPWPPPSARRP